MDGEILGDRKEIKEYISGTGMGLIILNKKCLLINIQVENYPGLQIPLQFEFNDQISLINDSLNHLIPIPNNSYSLTYKGFNLDTNKTFHDYKIFSQEIVSCFGRISLDYKIILIIKSKLILDILLVIGVNFPDKMSEIKLQISRQLNLNLSMRKLNLFFNQIELEDHLTVNDYNFPNLSTIFLEIID